MQILEVLSKSEELGYWILSCVHVKQLLKSFQSARRCLTAFWMRMATALPPDTCAKGSTMPGSPFLPSEPSSQW